MTPIHERRVSLVPDPRWLPAWGDCGGVDVPRCGGWEAGWLAGLAG